MKKYKKQNMRQGFTKVPLIVYKKTLSPTSDSIVGTRSPCKFESISLSNIVSYVNIWNYNKIFLLRSDPIEAQNYGNQGELWE